MFIYLSFSVPEINQKQHVPSHFPRDIWENRHKDGNGESAREYHARNNPGTTLPVIFPAGYSCERHGKGNGKTAVRKRDGTGKIPSRSVTHHTHGNLVPSRGRFGPFRSRPVTCSPILTGSFPVPSHIIPTGIPSRFSVQSPAYIDIQYSYGRSALYLLTNRTRVDKRPVPI